MFSFCFHRTRDSSLRQERRDGLTESYRHWVSTQPRAQGLKLFSRMKLRKTQGNSGQSHSDSAQTRNVPHNIWSREAGLLERLVTNLVPAYQKGDLFFVEIFLRNYRRWGTMEQVMDIIFKNALCSIITMWMDCCPGDFYKCQNQDTLHELMYYVWLYMPSSDLLLRLEIILSDLENSVKKKNNKRRKESLYRRFRASLRCHRAASPELPISIPAVISTMVTREELEQSLDSGQHVKPEESVNCVEKPEQALCPVYSECILNSTNVTQAPAGPLQEEKDDGDSPLTFTVRLDQPRVSEVSTPGVQDKASPEGLMEYASSLSSREPLKDAQKVVSVEESEFVLTNKQICPDKSVQLQEIKSPPEELEPAPAPPQEGNPIFTEEVDPLEDSDSEYLPEGNLEAGLDLDIPSPIPEKILLFLFVMAVVKCALYLLL
ncbi:uncharacterized protein RHO17_015430 isoform 2-T2 [Thomomys bottae]